MTSRHMRSRTVTVLRALGSAGFLRLAASMICSVNHYYLLGKDLGSSCDTDCDRDLLLVPMTDDDLPRFRRLLPSLNEADRKELLSRLFFYEDGFKNCYLMKKGEDIMYMQWIIFPSENPTIWKMFPTKFKPLRDTQIMVENAFTFPRHRGKGHLYHGTQQLLKLAREKGYRFAICYIRKDRISSLNEFVRMGFHIVSMISEYKVCGHAWRTI